MNYFQVLIIKMLWRSLCILLMLMVLDVTAQRRDRNNKRYKVVCFLASWANYRAGDGKFVIENIDPNLCTHLIYTFAKLQDNKIAVFDAHLDLKDNYGLGAYQRFNNLKKRNRNLSTLISIGGWNEGSTKFSKMVSASWSRSIFIKSVVYFCLKYNFDGVDVDWEYPANRGGASSDKHNFVSLLREMKAAFNHHGLILSASVAAGKNIIDTAYDIPGIAKYLDFMNVMTHGMHGSWDKITGHPAPLHEVESVIKHWINRGAPRNKLILGMGTYGRTYTLANKSNNKYRAPTIGPGNAGSLTKTPGMLGYNEICRISRNEVFLGQIQAPYAYIGNQWFGYDNPKSLSIKVDYLKRERLGGGMLWSLDTDDFKGSCGGGRYPLLSTISRRLNG